MHRHLFKGFVWPHPVFGSIAVLWPACEEKMAATLQFSCRTLTVNVNCDSPTGWSAQVIAQNPALWMAVTGLHCVWQWLACIVYSSDWPTLCMVVTGLHCVWQWLACIVYGSDWPALCMAVTGLQCEWQWLACNVNGGDWPALCMAATGLHCVWQWLACTVNSGDWACIMNGGDWPALCMVVTGLHCEWWWLACTVNGGDWPALWMMVTGLHSEWRWLAYSWFVFQGSLAAQMTNADLLEKVEDRNYAQYLMAIIKTEKWVHSCLIYRLYKETMSAMYPLFNFTNTVCS